MFAALRIMVELIRWLALVRLATWYDGLLGLISRLRYLARYEEDASLLIKWLGRLVDALDHWKARRIARRARKPTYTDDGEPNRPCGC